MDLAAGATIFTGFVSSGGTGCAPTPSSLSAVPYLGVMITGATLPCASSFRVPVNAAPVLHHRYAVTLAKTAAQIVTGNLLTVHPRANIAATWTWYLAAYTTAGAQAGISAGVAMTGVVDSDRTLSMVAASVTVPAGGFLTLRATSVNTTARIYQGATGGAASGPAGILTTTETPAAVADNTSDVGATAPSFGAVVSASFTAPSTKTASCNIQDSTSTAVPNGLDVLVVNETTNTIVATVQTTGGTGAVSHQDTKVTHPDYVFVLRHQVGFTTETITTPAVTPV